MQAFRTRAAGSGPATIVLLLSLLCASWVTTVTANDECTLECPLDAPCTFGDGTALDDHSHADGKLSLDGMHCDCPYGWTGIQCDHKYETCSLKEKGEHHCHHGGKCVSGFIDRYGNEQPYCDCRDAVTHGGTRFTGKYCETEVVATCSDTNPHHFCVHGGECNMNYEFAGGMPCFCGDNYEGEHCEFKKGETPECTLECGPGRCVVGSRSPEEFEFMDRVWTNEEISEHMYCECPEGTGGVNCQAQSTVCGSPQDHSSMEEHICFHGASCLQFHPGHGAHPVKDVKYQCDCTVAFDPEDPDAKFAGDHCQYKSSHICRNENYADTENFFCVNDGECPLDPLDDCVCPPTYTGAKCEYSLGSPSDDDDDEDDGNDGTDIPPPVLCGPTNVCHNGGKCVKGEFGRFCDCSAAVVDGLIYSGNSCEFPSTSFCTDPDPITGSLDGVRYCANNGKCNKHHPDAGCKCNSAFEGLHCEFEIDGDSVVDIDEPLHPGEDQSEPCGADLTCLHGSTCSTGALEDPICDCAGANRPEKDIYYAGKECEFISSHHCPDSLVPFCVNGGACPSAGSSQCKCHSGFTGRMCEIEVTDDPTQDDDPNNDDAERCGDTHCFNGGRCVQHDDTEFCECSHAFTNTVHYAGDSCQYPSTVICDDTDGLLTLEGVHFCTNKGRCNQNVKGYCDCGTNWRGKHCEFQADEVEDNDDVGKHPDPIPCGETECQNGGICRTAGAAEPYCDCAAANQDPGIFYAGDSCQYPSTKLCDNGHFCTNGGKCKNKGIDGCTCHTGWTGDKCEIEVSADDAVTDTPPTEVDQFVKCGDKHHCYFGGTCIAAEIRGETIYECDCSTAFDAVAGVLYDGEYCQYQSTMLCTENVDNNNFGETEFCVNGGNCRQNDIGCTCPTGYTGLRCEATIYDNEADAEDNIRPDDGDDSDGEEDPGECHIDCLNDGKCKTGAKDLGDLDDAIEHVEHLNQTHHKDYFEHCVCPKGFTGVTCGYKVEICGENQHHCLHGSKCVSNEGQHACDCALADETLDGDNENALYAGESCQHAATDICTTGSVLPGRPLHFCTNNGKCKSYVSADKPHPGCECADNWIGESCEVRVGSDAVQDSQRTVGPGPDNSVSVMAIAVSTVVIVLTIILAVIILIRSQSPESRDESATCMQLRRRRKNRFSGAADHVNLAPKRDPTFRPLVKDADPISSSSDPMAAGLALEPDDEPEVYLGPPRDEDGHELHNVDII
eukprot:CAMPEP_0119559076 /NCGR_PEP_ID=MMETSP1352-20130426/11797_1 /TAXON_ID=265584 /ORGANISM="Stauroneis constricta, Strain CCMP1120" /LENGTH=1231 /DNA_ID=CAMNT_0007606639 /DNA_START=288 /DNA_END=3983 /DNA_ORIENTATION=-